jgi:hypothetical protein
MFTNSNSRRATPSAEADASPKPAVNTAPAADQEVEWVKRFPLRLKAYGQWMKQFLHGGR